MSVGVHWCSKSATRKMPFTASIFFSFRDSVASGSVSFDMPDDDAETVVPALAEAFEKLRSLMREYERGDYMSLKLVVEGMEELNITFKTSCIPSTVAFCSKLVAEVLGVDIKKSTEAFKSKKASYYTEFDLRARALSLQWNCRAVTSASSCLVEW